jgi:hypothetical protein
VQALFGTSYAAPMHPYRYVWTDTGVEGARGDVDCEGPVSPADRLRVRAQFAQGPLVITNPGPDFSVYDINADHRVDLRDSIWYCPADADDNLVLNVSDFTAYLQWFAASDPVADINRDGALNIGDFTAFLQIYAAGCP